MISVRVVCLDQGRSVSLSLPPHCWPANGATDMVDYHGHFVWYELMTTDVAAAKAFYTRVVGWGMKDASTPDLAYTLFTVGKASVTGLINLPEDARKMGATPRWIGYVGVKDVDAAVDRI